MVLSPLLVTTWAVVCCGDNGAFDSCPGATSWHKNATHEGSGDDQTSQKLRTSLGVTTMQLNDWITNSICALTAITAAALTSGSASADVYQRPGRVVPVAGCANFGGFYVGGNIGWATLTAHQNDLDGVFTSTPMGFTVTDDT